MRLIPIVTALASLGMVAAMVGSGTTALKHNPMLLIFPVTLVVSAAAAAIAGSAAGQRSADVDADRRCYLEYLTALSGRLTEDAAGLRDWLESNHPAPEVLWAVAGSARMWVRPVGHSDFCVVRVATGAISAYTRLIGPTEAGSEERDPVTTAALRRFLHAHRRVTGAPITVAMAAASSVTIVGESDRVRALVRAMICQLAALHSPADVGIAAVVGAVQSAHWDWLKWLPHHRHPTAVDDVGAARMCYRDDPDSLYTWGRDDRRIVVVVDADVSGPVPDADTTVLRIAQQDCATADIRIVTDAGETMLDCPDRMTVAQALAVARRIAGHPPARGRGKVPGGWLGRVGVVDPSRVDPIALWDARFGEPLSTPIGNAADGTFVDLDIRESAAGGVGPHGLCLGATGSGKSELLRTIVLGMLARHPPDALNLILIDFKGGATFLDLANTRHTAAVITNLADEAYLVDRLAEALTGEIDRRQQILRAAGNVASIAEYDRARQAGRLSAPLPALFIVVDEFSELLSRHPEFIDVFTAIGRLGRSLGMHLLLASQRLDEGRLRGLDSHLSYRICLKTLSANESRTAIGSPDAYHLPGRPGAAYLKVADAEPVRFQACFVSGGFEPTSPMLQSGAAAPGPALFTAAATGRVFTASTARVVDAGPPRTLLQCLAHRLAGVGRQAHPVWLPPVADSPCLDALIPACGGGDLRVPVGLVDRTFEHVRCPLVLDLSGSAGHVAVVGAPRTGKTTALRTLVTALAATHDPRRVQVYCLDFGGGGLAALDTLPHVGSVAGRSDTALARRVATEILGVLHRREASESAAARDPRRGCVLGDRRLERRRQAERRRGARGGRRDRRFGFVIRSAPRRECLTVVRHPARAARSDRNASGASTRRSGRLRDRPQPRSSGAAGEAGSRGESRRPADGDCSARQRIPAMRGQLAGAGGTAAAGSDRLRGGAVRRAGSSRTVCPGYRRRAPHAGHPRFHRCVPTTSAHFRRARLWQDFRAEAAASRDRQGPPRRSGAARGPAAHHDRQRRGRQPAPRPADRDAARANPRRWAATPSRYLCSSTTTTWSRPHWLPWRKWCRTPATSDFMWCSPGIRPTRPGHCTNLFLPRSAKSGPRGCR